MAGRANGGTGVLAPLVDEGSTAEEREAVYVALEESVVRAAGDEAANLAAEATKALITAVLCAPTTRVGVAEFRRAGLLLGEMSAQHPLAVVAEMARPGTSGMPRFFEVWDADGGVFAELLAASDFTREEAITVACSEVAWVTMHTGMADMMSYAGLRDNDFMEPWMAHCPYINKLADASVGLQLFNLARSPDGQPEGVVSGAWFLLCWVCLGRPEIARPVYDAGFLDAAMAALQPHSPIERIGKKQLLCCGVFCGANHVIKFAMATGLDVVPALLESGFIDIAISNMTAYQVRTLARPFLHLRK